MNEIYQHHLELYLKDINPTFFIETLDKEIKEREVLLSSTIKKRTQIRKKMDDLVNLRLNGELTKDHFAELYKPFEIQIEQFDKSIPELEAEIDYRKIQLNSSDLILSEAKALYSEWKDMQLPQRRAIAETITEGIIISEDKIDIALAYLPTSSQTSPRNFMGSSRRST